jgi:hypothetical protein
VINDMVWKAFCIALQFVGLGVIAGYLFITVIAILAVTLTSLFLKKKEENYGKKKK